MDPTNYQFSLLDVRPAFDSPRCGVGSHEGGVVALVLLGAESGRRQRGGRAGQSSTQYTERRQLMGDACVKRRVQVI